MSQHYKSKSIEHLGLVSGLCKEAGIVEILDTLAPKQSHHSKISFGPIIFSYDVKWPWVYRAYIAYVSSIF